MFVEALGWAAALLLLATMARQVWVQWQSRSVAGVSRSLFVGQMAASIGFTAYSALLGNTVFVLTNALMVLNGLVGLYVDRRNRRLAARGESDAPPEGPRKRMVARSALRPAPAKARCNRPSRQPSNTSGLM